MRNADGQRLPLKSTLLLGVAGMAAAAISNSALAADAAPSSTPAASPTPVTANAPAASTATPIPAPKWLPSVDIGGGVGSGFTVGRAEAFVPVWQDLDSLLFVRFGADTRTHYDGNFNLGLGYRTKVDSDWLIGVFAGVDSSHTDFSHTFKQYSLGAEAMSADWDIRANAYFADHSSKPVTDSYELYIHDTTIAVLQAQEAALSGFDGEVGYRVFNTDSTDVRVFAGGYSFHHSDVNTAGVGTTFSMPYKDISGPKLRAEVNVFDIDALGAQSRLSFEGEVSHDNVNHTSAFIGATLRIALDDTSGQGAQALDELDRRMADPVRRRDDILTQQQFNKPEPVIIYNGSITSHATNTLYYAEQRSGTGAGTYADPTTLKDAAGRGPNNQFIVLTDKGGSTIDTTGTVVQTGETVTGAGTFKVRGTQSGQVFTHDFAPGSGAVSLTATSGPVITIHGDASLSDFSITGPFDTAIYGSNVGDVEIKNVTIDGGGAGHDGIVIDQSDTSGTANIDIDNVSITGLTHDGIDLNVNGTSGGTSTTNLNVSNSTVHVGHDGVAVTSSASGASNLTVYAGIHDSTIVAGGTGTAMSGTTSAGATLNQSIVVDPTAISGGLYGVHITATADGGSFTQNISLSDVTISNVSKGGVVISASADQAGTLDQGIDITDLDIASTDTPFSISAMADHNATLQQSLTADHLSVGVGASNNLGFYASAHNGGALSQTFALSHVTADNAPADGVYMYASSDSGATAIQKVSINSLSAKHSGLDGVGEILDVGGAGSVGAQYLTLIDAALEHSGRNGVYASAISHDQAVARQDVYVSGANVSDAGYDGIKVYSAALDGASMQQNAYLYNINATHAGNDGIGIFNYAHGGFAFAAQGGAIAGIDVSYAGGNGLAFGSVAKAADTEQQLYAYYVTAEHNGKNGISIATYANGYATGTYQSYPAHVEQDLGIIYGDITHNTNDGVLISNSVSNSAALDQSVFLYGLHIDHNGNHGVEQQSFLRQTEGASYPNYVAQAHLYSSLYVDNSTVEYNARDGIHIYSLDVGTAGMQVHASVEGSTVSSNGGNGVYDSLIEAGTYGVYVLNNGLDVVGSIVDHNAANGIDIETAAYGPTVLIFNLNVVGSDVSYNAADGLHDYAYAAGFDSLNLHYVGLNGSLFDVNGGNGVSMIAVQNYGYGLRGIAGQIATISSSDFSYNHGDGVYSHALSIGPNGRTEQYFYISGSRFDHNGHDGLNMQRTTTGGAYYANYSCSVPQYSYGGCAFVRQVVQISGSDFSHNTADGIELDTDLGNYGSAYNSAGHPAGQPTLYIGDSTINYNGGDGIHIDNNIGVGSDEYQFVYISHTQIAHNGGDGIHVYNYNYGGSQLQALVVANGSDVSHNTGNGISLATTAYHTPEQVNLLEVDGSSISSNGVYGVSLDSYVAVAFISDQAFYASGSKFDGNASGGVNMTDAALGAYYAYQVIKLNNNEFADNIGSGLYAIFGSLGDYAAGQYVYSTDDVFKGNAGFGLYAGFGALGQYNTAVQHVDLTGDTASANYLGVGITGYAAASALSQKIGVVGGAFNGNEYVGMYVQSISEYGSQITSNISAKNAEFDGNGAGLVFSSYADGTSAGAARVSITGSTFSGNVAGVYLYADNTTQHALIQGNSFTDNSLYGIEAYAANGSHQNFNVHTNTHSGDGANYYFGHDGTSTQHIVY